VLSLAGGSDEVAALAAGLADELSAAGRDVLLDDREARPGEKFADADLLGCPLRVTVGKKSLDDGSVDIRRRPETEDVRVKRTSVKDWTPED
jgi:prolyl-tRNA synthetase